MTDINNEIEHDLSIDENSPLECSQQRINETLKSLKIAVSRASIFKDMFESSNSFLDALKSIPNEFHSLTLSLDLGDRKFVKDELYPGELDESGKLVIQIPVPRTWNIFEKVDPLKREFTSDGEIKDSPCFYINPTGFETDSKEPYPLLVFPRQIYSITIGEDFPNHLDDKTRKYVEDIHTKTCSPEQVLTDK